MDRDLFWLSDEQFARISPHLPRDTRGKPRVDDLRVISGIVHVLKSGGPGQDGTERSADGADIEVRCSAIVNAAGPWADMLATMAGAQPLGMMPLRRTIYQPMLASLHHGRVLTNRLTGTYDLVDKGVVHCFWIADHGHGGVVHDCIALSQKREMANSTDSCELRWIG